MNGLRHILCQEKKTKHFILIKILNLIILTTVDLGVLHICSIYTPYMLHVYSIYAPYILYIFACCRNINVFLCLYLHSEEDD